MSSRVLLRLCLALFWTVLAAEDIQSSPSLRSSAPSSAGGSAEEAMAAAQGTPPKGMDEDRAKAGAEARGQEDSSESAAFATAAGLPAARTLFKQTDANGDGYLSRGEVRAAMRRRGIRLAASDFNAKFGKADSNGDGRLSWGEASRAFAAYRR